MFNFNRGVDPLDFVLKLREFVKSIDPSSNKGDNRNFSANPFGQPNFMPMPSDFSKLNEYIKNTLDQSLNHHLNNIFNNQPFNNPLSRPTATRGEDTKADTSPI